MSDHGEAAGFSGAFGGSEIRGPQEPCQLQWMGHWKNSGSVSAQRIHRNPADGADVHEEEFARRLQRRTAKFSESKETPIGNGQISDRGTLPVTPDAPRSAHGLMAEKGTVDITGECPDREIARAFDAERMKLSKASLCRIESSCVDSKNVHSSLLPRSGILRSEWQHRTEFNVNQRTRVAARSKRKSGQWDTSLDRGLRQITKKESASAPDEVNSMAGEFQFHGEYTVQQSRRFYRFFEKKRLSNCGHSQNDSMGLTSTSALGGFSQMTDAGPSIFSREENICSLSGAASKEKLANHTCLNLEHEISEPCHHSLFGFSKQKRSKKLILGCSLPMPRDQSLKAHGDSPTEVSGSELLLIKSSLQGFTKLNESFCEQHFQQRVLGISTRDIGSPRERTNLNSVGRLVGVPPESKSSQYLQVTKNTDMELPRGGRIRRTPESGENTRIRKLSSSLAGYVRPPGLPISDKKKHGQSISAYSADVQNKSPVIIDCMNMDGCRGKQLCSGESSGGTDKKGFMGTQDIGKFELTSALQMNGATVSSQETELLDKSMVFSPFLVTSNSMNPKGSSTSKIDSMLGKHIISQVVNEKSDSGHQQENYLGPEESSRWVKRLKLNSESLAIGPGDSNMEDVPTTRRVHKLFSRVMNYSRSNTFTLAKCLQEQQQFEKTVLVLRNNDSPMESLKESHPWIQRWCQISQEAFHPKTRKPIEVLCEPEKAKPLPENLEGKLFPSLAAMALMGKSINNFRPCEIRRRGSSLVWHTEGF
uniref:F-box protein At2g16365 n=1 Tax=Anthurium amnicola TaxID=1678845 RepID=A0A1D1YNW8_9ARAE